MCRFSTDCPSARRAPFPACSLRREFHEPFLCSGKPGVKRSQQRALEGHCRRKTVLWHFQYGVCVCVCVFTPQSWPKHGAQSMAHLLPCRPALGRVFLQATLLGSQSSAWPPLCTNIRPPVAPNTRGCHSRSLLLPHVAHPL